MSMVRDAETRARKSIMLALKERSTEVFLKVATPRGSASVDLQNSITPRYGDFDIDAAMDTVMDRFPKALERLAK